MAHLPLGLTVSQEEARKAAAEHEKAMGCSRSPRLNNSVPRLHSLHCKWNVTGCLKALKAEYVELKREIEFLGIVSAFFAAKRR